MSDDLRGIEMSGDEVGKIFRRNEDLRLKKPFLLEKDRGVLH